MGQRAFLFVVSLTTVFLYSGIVFGWTSLQDILVKEGFYSARCAPGEEQPCVPQLKALSQAYTIASTLAQAVALPGGAFLDRYGPRRTIVVSAVLVSLGSVGMAVCEKIGSVDFDVFLISFSLLAVGGPLVLFATYNCAFLLPERSSLILGLNSSLFDGSCLVFPLFKVAYGVGISFNALCWSFTGLAVVCYSLLFWAWTLNGADIARVRAATASNANSQRPAATDAVAPRGCLADLRPDLSSLEFFVVTAFTIVQVMRSNTFMGIIGYVVNQIGGPNVESILTAIGLIIPLGCLAVPAIEFSTSRFGILGTLQVTSFLGIVYNVLELVPSLYLQLVTTLIFTVWRAFLYTAISEFNAQTFGILKMGRLQGIGFLLGAALNMSQAPLVAFSLTALHGDFRPFLWIMLVAALPFPLLWALVKWYGRQPPEEAEREGSVRDDVTPRRTHSCASVSSLPYEIGAAVESSPRSVVFEGSLAENLTNV